MPWTRRDLLLLFTACAVPVHVWAILSGLREAPAWMVRLDAVDLVAVAAYTLAFALAESLLVWLLAAAAAGLLPARLLGATGAQSASAFRLAWGSWLVLVSGLASASLHWFPALLRPPWPIALGLACLTCLAGGLLLLRRAPRLRLAVRGLLDRLVVLALAYVAVDLVGLAVVLARNIA